MGIIGYSVNKPEDIDLIFQSEMIDLSQKLTKFENYVNDLKIRKAPAKEADFQNHLNGIDQKIKSFIKNDIFSAAFQTHQVLLKKRIIYSVYLK
jgi:hypothetical protein